MGAPATAKVTPSSSFRKVLLTLGKPGQAGNAPDLLVTPSDVITAANGDIFVADGHGVLDGHQTNDRIVKLSKDGTFIAAWGKHGSAPGEFDVPHSLAMVSAGRLYVGDQQPRPDFRSKRDVCRRMETVWPAEQRHYR